MDILAVIVRYKTPLSESQTLRGFTNAFHVHPGLLNGIRILIWDNSPEPLGKLDLPFPAEYRHSAHNTGVSGAYNGALPVAEGMGVHWMLLLDQDTSLTAYYLDMMLHHAQVLISHPEIAAITPTVRVGDLVVSPLKTRFNSHRIYEGPNGIVDGQPFAINSGCLMRVEALRRIGGFSLDFWLDFSDRYVFHQFAIHGLRVWRATDAELQHEMSILDYDNLMPVWRYQNFIGAEGAFNDLYKGWFENSVQTLRLWVRAVRQRLRYKNPEFSRITWRHLWHRLTTGRKRRLALWQQAQRARIASTESHSSE